MHVNNSRNGETRFLIANRATATDSRASFAAYAENSYAVMGTTSDSYNAINFFGTGGDSVAYFYPTNVNEFVIGTYQDDPLIFGQNNLEVMRIHDNGFVGIGATSPTEKLMINGSLKVQNSSGTLALYVNESTGKVGIGTATPFTLLDVEAKNPEIRMTSNAGAVGDGGTLTLLSYTDDKSYAQIKGFWSGSGDADITFYTTTDGASTIPEKMRITHDGNVGIGTTSPTSKLHINGSANITGNITVGNLINLGVTSTLPTCGITYNGSIVRNDSGVYGCSTNSVWTKIF